MKRVTASREGILVLVDELGRSRTFPPEAMAQVEGILTTPAIVRRSRRTNTGIAEDYVVLQPGEEGHVAASFDAAGYRVVVHGEVR